MMSGDTEQGEYSGYQLKNAADFETRDLREAPNGNQANILSKIYPDLKLDGTETDIVSVVSAAISFILFMVFVIILASDADCKMGLCDKIDESSTSDTVYSFQVFDFVAPIKFILGSLIVVSLSLFLVSIYSALLLRRDNGSDPLRVVSAVLRIQGRKQIISRIIITSVLIFPLFLLTGFGSGWRSAGCLYFGAAFTFVISIVCGSLSSRLSLRTAALTSSGLAEKIGAARLSGTILAILSLCCGLGGSAFCYLIFKDVRALIGFALGSLSSTLILTLVGGIYKKSVNIVSPLGGESCQPGTNSSALYDSTICQNLGIITGKLCASATAFCAMFATATIVTAVKGASLPFFRENQYAMCVFNHLRLDKICVSFESPTSKESFAVTLCRVNDFFTNYPQLKTLESNSLFVAYPFILGFTTIAITLLCTTYVPLPQAQTGIENEEERIRRQRKFSIRLWFTVFLTIVLSIICGAGLSWGLFGKNSAFQKATSGTYQKYELKQSDDPLQDPCRPTIGQEESENNVLPDLNISRGPYEPLIGDGSEFSSISSIAWRLFMCYLIGIIAGFLVGESGELLLLFRTPRGNQVIATIINGSAMALLDLFGYGFILALLPVSMITLVIAISYALFDEYGIGIASIGMLSTAGSFLHLSVSGIILESANKLSQATKSTSEVVETRDGLEGVTKPFIRISFRYICGCAFVISCSLLLLIAEEANFMPSSRQLAGRMDGRPTHHITDMTDTNLINIYVLFSFFVGVLISILFTSLILFGGNRSSQLVILSLRKKYGNVKNSMKNAEMMIGINNSCDKISFQQSLIESIIPIIVSIFGPIIVGFGFGQKAVISLVGGVICGSFIQSMSFEGIQRALHLEEEFTYDEKFKYYENKLRMMIEGGSGMNDSLNENVGGSSCIFGVMVSCFSVVIVRLMEIDLRRGWIGIIMLIMMILIWIGMMIVIEWIFKKELDGEGEYEMKEEAKVDMNIVSPFYEEGPTLVREHINPRSELGMARKDVTVIPMLEI